MIYKKMFFKELLAELNNIDEDFDVYFYDTIDKISLDTVCGVSQQEDCDLDYLSLSIAQVVDVVENIKQQKKNYSMKEILDGIIFYMENDAFIEIS